MKQYVLSLDEGTTSARSILFDKNCKVAGLAQHELPCLYPRPGWVEQDPMDIFANQLASLTECIAKSGVSPEEIASIGITNQRETAIVWDKTTGKPVYNAIVWQCRRTADICRELERSGCTEQIRSKTGLRPDPYFSGTKIKWILDHVRGAREKAERGELLFGTVDTWLVWKLTEGRVHATDRTNASRTMLYNIHTLSWDSELCKLLQIPMSMLPEVKSSGAYYGEVNLAGKRVPICGIAGDQQAALYGQGCVSCGDMKITYGTGCFLLSHTGESPVVSRHGLLTTVAATLGTEPVQYALEGSVFTGGAVIQWLRDGLRLITDASDSEYFSAKVKNSGGVYLVPAFSGLGAPYWNADARGILTGITAGTTREHIIRAALESIAFQSNDVIDAMQSDTGALTTALRVDGGASANRLLMQFQADISNVEVLRPNQKEATALGAALLAGRAAGFYPADGSGQAGPGTVFKPCLPQSEREALLDGWHRAVSACTYKGESI